MIQVLYKIKIKIGVFSVLNVLGECIPSFNDIPNY